MLTARTRVDLASAHATSKSQDLEATLPNGRTRALTRVHVRLGGILPVVNVELRAGDSGLCSA